ncbi:MAG: GerMN domain-containing protein [Treponema sp.]|nr:GerMN domain-containing protein [Treponema sp.]
MRGQRTYRRASGRKYPQKRQKAKIPAGLIFWTAFSILIAGLFFINRDRIMDSLEKTQFLERLSSSTHSGNPVEERSVAGQDSANREAERVPPPAPPPRRETEALPESSPRPGIVQSPPRPIEQRDFPPATRHPAESSVEQTLYFIRVEDDGTILRTKTARRIPVSGTPLQDTLRALITGPGAEEERQGVISLIPPETRVLSAVIEGSTARINFSEEFQYNTAGMEGFAAQLTQIVWTVTEFPNVKDVQILIEGNKVDHLGEGLPIWGPLNRQSF